MVADTDGRPQQFISVCGFISLTLRGTKIFPNKQQRMTRHLSTTHTHVNDVAMIHVCMYLFPLGGCFHVVSVRADAWMLMHECIEVSTGTG